jgi:hypothetical protein
VMKEGQSIAAKLLSRSVPALTRCATRRNSHVFLKGHHNADTTKPHNADMTKPKIVPAAADATAITKTSRHVDPRANWA